MTIKSDKETLHIFVGLFIASLFCFFTLLSYNVGIVFPILVLVVMLYFSMRYLITIGRVFEIDEKGCTVRFFCISKFYKWDELTVKSYLNLTQIPINGSSNYGSVIFSPHHIRRPNWMQLVPYCVFIHLFPFSFIFINFKKERIYYEKWTYVHPDIYVFDEYLFEENLRAWNITITK